MKSQVTVKIKKSATERFSQVGFEIHFVLIIIAGLGAKPCVDVGGKHLAIKGLEANKKFIDRFTLMEEMAYANGKTLSGMSLEEMDALWTIIKQQNK